jgi:hypothetical protein
VLHKAQGPLAACPGGAEIPLAFELLEVLVDRAEGVEAEVQADLLVRRSGIILPEVVREVFVNLLLASGQVHFPTGEY